jgi:hypothetical protein
VAQPPDESDARDDAGDSTEDRPDEAQDAGPGRRQAPAAPRRGAEGLQDEQIGLVVEGDERGRGNGGGNGETKIGEGHDEELSVEAVVEAGLDGEGIEAEPGQVVVGGGEGLPWQTGGVLHVEGQRDDTDRDPSRQDGWQDDHSDAGWNGGIVHEDPRQPERAG